MQNRIRLAACSCLVLAICLCLSCSPKVSPPPAPIPPIAENKPVPAPLDKGKTALDSAKANPSSPEFEIGPCWKLSDSNSEDHLYRCRDQGLDVVFAFDSTGGMGGIILETQTRIRELMRVITYLVPNARLGLVTYRDTEQYDPAEHEYTTKSKALTTDANALEQWLKGIEAYGGGDNPEDIYDGLNVAMNLRWRQGSVKIIIVFGSAPPHSENDGLSKINELCKKWRKMTGGQISCIDTSDYPQDAKVMPEFKAMADAGGGYAVLLKDEHDLIRQLCLSIFGARNEEFIDDAFKTVLKGQPAEPKANN